MNVKCITDRRQVGSIRWEMHWSGAFREFPPSARVVLVSWCRCCWRADGRLGYQLITADRNDNVDHSGNGWNGTGSFGIGGADGISNIPIRGSIVIRQVRGQVSIQYTTEKKRSRRTGKSSLVG
jgi:hypothetical protein